MHRLRFDQSCIGAIDSRWPTKLAVAARTSACIPGVFEPSYLPIDTTDAAASGLPDFKQHASFAKSQFGVDGGAVNDRPLGEALLIAMVTMVAGLALDVMIRSWFAHRPTS